MSNNIGSEHPGDEAHTCLLCGSAELETILAEGWQRFGVTSDCKPYPDPAPLAVCKDCAHIQKIIDSAYLTRLKKIYDGYEMYTMGGGEEQQVFHSGEHSARSVVIFNHMANAIRLPSSGNMLDIGCGNGGALKSFHKSYPQWELYGFEMDDRNRETILALPGVHGFYAGALAAVDGSFDLISMLHVIEHLAHPESLLISIKEKLRDEGHLLIQTADFLTNPFDLLIADHCSHFTLSSLAFFLKRLGFGLQAASESWIKKEISAVVTKKALPGIAGKELDTAKSVSIVKKNAAWLDELKQLAVKASGTGNMGIHGTSIAGTWLASSLEGELSFFSDEDPARCGRTHMELKTLSLADVPAGSKLLLAFPPEVSAAIHNRLSAKYRNIEFITPPPF